MNLATHNLLQVLKTGFLKHKTKVTINYSQLTVKILKQFQSEGIIRYFEIISVKSHFRINIFLSNYSKLTSFKVLSKVQKRLYSKKSKIKDNLGLSSLYSSNSCSLLKSDFGESLFIIR